MATFQTAHQEKAHQDGARAADGRDGSAARPGEPEAHEADHALVGGPETGRPFAAGTRFEGQPVDWLDELDVPEDDTHPTAIPGHLEALVLASRATRPPQEAPRPAPADPEAAQAQAQGPAAPSADHRVATAPPAARATATTDGVRPQDPDAPESSLALSVLSVIVGAAVGVGVGLLLSALLGG